jgi:hypothetical protein
MHADILACDDHVVRVVVLSTMVRTVNIVILFAFVYDVYVARFSIKLGLIMYQVPKALKNVDVAYKKKCKFIIFCFW